MKTLWKAAAISVLTAAVLAWAPGAEAAEKGKGPALHQCTGKIASISGECIAVDARGGQQKFVVNDKTKFGTKAEPKKCDDFKAGDKVTVRFKEEGDKKIAVSVGPPAAPKAKGAKK
jgi:hypothetical protein